MIFNEAIFCQGNFHYQWLYVFENIYGGCPKNYTFSISLDTFILKIGMHNTLVIHLHTWETVHWQFGQVLVCNIGSKRKFWNTGNCKISVYQWQFLRGQQLGLQQEVMREDIELFPTKIFTVSALISTAKADCCPCMCQEMCP